MKLVFDLGCNRGEFTAAVFEKYPEAKVVAVDANPAMQEFVSQRFGNKVTPVCCIIAEDDGDREFFISPENGISTASNDWMTKSRFASGSKYIQSKSQWDKLDKKIHSLTIDDLIDVFGVPDYIKVDLEGYELNAIVGLSQKVNELCFEWTEEESDKVELAVAHLESIGFTKFGVKGYFDQETPENFTSVGSGDDFLVLPDHYAPWEELKFKETCTPSRKVNWGMIHARS